MRVWFMGLPREARWVTATVGAAASIILMFFVFKVLAVSVTGLQEIGQHKPRIARLNGYEAVSEQLKVQAKNYEAAVSAISYSSEIASDQIGASLQQTLRGFAQEAGLVVTGSRFVVIAREEESEQLSSEFEKIMVNLTFDGPPMALDAFLLSVGEHSPSLATESLDIQRKRRSRGDNRDTFEWLTVQLRVVALRVDS